MTDIVDAHHHIWRQADMPWLSGPMQPRIFGPYGPIRRDYLIDEFLEDLSGTGVIKSVYVQANWPKEKFEDEVAWVSEVADTHGWPHGIVGYADVTVDDVRPQLDRLTKYPLMRGVRMQLHWHENETYRFAARPDLATDPKVQRNVAALADYGWSFDLQVFAPQMAGAAQLAAACPKVTFILQHAGMLEDLSEKGRADWRSRHDGARRAAECRVQDIRARHLHPCQRSGAHRADHARDRRDLRLAAYDVRLEFSDREDLDLVRGTRRRTRGCRGEIARG